SLAGRGGGDDHVGAAAVGDRRPVPAHSMLSVLSLGAGHGTEVTLHAEDDDEAGAERALDTLAELLASDLDVQDPGDDVHAQEPAGA
ncbi:MAG: phosphocarrier protein HPr, partial [Streptosporangiaceae bacterium]|nr:phosphocarrier protein HPr [Streptosporangiaceae bacterium]